MTNLGSMTGRLSVIRLQHPVDRDVQSDSQRPGGFALRTVSLSKRYGRVTALDDLCLEVPAGEVFGFLGPNGAGKSTTIRMLLGQARPTEGRAWVFDTDAADVARAHRLLPYVPADVALWPQLTVRRSCICKHRPGPGTDLAYREELVERFALDTTKAARTYSGRRSHWSRLSPPARRCWCWTSRPADLIR